MESNRSFKTDELLKAHQFTQKSQLFYRHFFFLYRKANKRQNKQKINKTKGNTFKLYPIQTFFV